MIATQIQVAIINKMLPKGFKFESYETVKRQVEQARIAAKQPPAKRRKNAEDNKKDDIKPEKIKKTQSAITGGKGSDLSQPTEVKRSSGRPRKAVVYEDLPLPDKKSGKQGGPSDKMSNEGSSKMNDKNDNSKLFATKVDNKARQQRDNGSSQNFAAVPQKQAPFQNNVPQQAIPAPTQQREMNIQERQTLGHNINFLNTDQLMGIYDIVKDSIPN